MVEHLLAKEKVAGSNPVFRSENVEPLDIPSGFSVLMQAANADYRSGPSLTLVHAGVAERQTLRS